MSSVAAKALDAGNDYKHEPLEGFSTGRKPRGTVVIEILLCIYTPGQ